MIPTVRRTVTVTQGEYRAEREPDVVLSTILGSCVSVCLYDPGVGVGGMNHFLLPQGQDTQGGRSEHHAGPELDRGVREGRAAAVAAA